MRLTLVVAVRGPVRRGAGIGGATVVGVLVGIGGTRKLLRLHTVVPVHLLGRALVLTGGRFGSGRAPAPGVLIRLQETPRRGLPAVGRLRRTGVRVAGLRLINRALGVRAVLTQLREAARRRLPPIRRLRLHLIGRALGA
ncbi:hypothetical protein UO65_1474 [Actinokineospora spheciospongiae]|uniref:Uncharacterized protein n=1 Tax=Actinokineospora spheciospongiae TaxID=909613 RepID=W7IQU4_9PSEU|nr:hypothetical protein [Actinokineospora spheciospongiae]EWC63260.1 hypothetical protein UO65_1474 [Actinokineospora spheciospongiae]